MMEKSLLAMLSGVHLHIFHPDAQSVRAFCTSLTQLGCHVQHSWPPSTSIPANTQLLLIAIELQSQLALPALFKTARQENIPIIALADCYDARLFPLLLELQPSSVADRELNPFTLIVQISGILNIMRQKEQLRALLQTRQQHKTRSERLAQAKVVLMQTYGLDESGAYRLMRSEAMNTRTSLEFTAERVIDTLQK